MASPPNIWPVQPIFNANSVPLSENNGTNPNMADTIMNWFQLLTFEKITKTIDATFQVVETTTPLEFQGVLQPFNPRQLMMKPEGQRRWRWYTIHALPVLQLFPDDVLVDQKGIQYRIKDKLNYERYGYCEYHAIEDYTGSGPTVE